MPGWMKHKLESRLLGEISTTSDMQMLTTLMAASEEKLKSLLIWVKEESEKSFLKLNIKKKKTKIMAYDPIISFQVEKVYAVTYVIFLGSKIMVDGDCSHEIKRHLLLGRKAMTNLDSIRLLLYLLIHLLLELLKWCTEMHSVNVKKKKKTQWSQLPNEQRNCVKRNLTTNTNN